MAITDLGDADWTVEPVSHDPFAPVPDSSRNQPVITGHIAATLDPGQQITQKYLQTKPQGSLSSYDPSWSERIQQGVSETAQRFGEPVENAEGLGSLVRTGAEFAPGASNVLSGNEAYRSIQAGDPWGALVHGAMALPIPGASAEEGAARRLTPLGFYSHGAEVAASLPQAKGTTQQMVAQLGKKGVKPAEMEGAGLNDLSDMPPTTIREELADMFHRNLPPLQETVLSKARDPGQNTWDAMSPAERLASLQTTRENAPPRYAGDAYNLPGGQNYREVLMHLPSNRRFAVHQGEEQISPAFDEAHQARTWAQSQGLTGSVREVNTGDNFNSSHWDQPNVVAHLRLNDRTGDNGEKLLHMEELQSDWGQRARDEGIAQPVHYLYYRNPVSGFTSPNFKDEAVAKDYFDRLPPNLQSTVQPVRWSQMGPGAPAGPYIGSTQGWTDLGLKRALIEAARGGYSHLSWTPGEDQGERWLQRHEVNKLRYYPDDKNLLGWSGDSGNEARVNETVEPQNLAGNLGKEQADLLLHPSNTHFAGTPSQFHELTPYQTGDLPLKAGGEGMIGYYNRIVPTQLSRIARKLDPNAKIGTSTISPHTEEFRRRGFTPDEIANATSDLRRMGVPLAKTVPSMEITPLMREQILKGLPQYRRGGRVGRQGGGGLDDDGVASDATGELNAQSRTGPLGRPGGIGGGESVRSTSGETSAPGGLSAEEAAEVARARAAAGPYQPVTGLPQKIIGLPDGTSYLPGPLEKAHRAAEAYMREAALSYDPPRDYAKVDPNFATRVAQAYEDMPHAPDDPAVRASYDALARETMAQWRHVKGTGLKIDWITPQTGDPYADNPRAAIRDIRDNNHWWGYPTDLGYGSGEETGKAAENPMLADSGEEISGRRANVNDIFRIVHDYFGHAKEGHGFRADGEDNAYRSHSAMYSDAAKPAMTTELRGQNSWLNYGPHGEHNRTAKAADTVFADQKIGVMPEWTWRPTPPAAVTRPAAGLMSQEEALQRQREGFEPPGEWTGGRIAMADGGALEPVEGDPFEGMHASLSAQPVAPPDQTVQPTDVNRAKGFPEPLSDMHRRISEASRDAAQEPESLAHYAGNPEHWMPMRIGAAIGEEGRRIGQGLWSAATLPGDIATGKTTMEDPAAQQRAMDLAAGITFAPAGEVPEGSLTAGLRRVRRPPSEMPEFTTSYEPPGWEAKAAELKPPPAELSTDTAKLSMIGHNKGPSIEQPLVNKALPSFEDPNFPEGRIATSVPTSVSRAAAAHDNNSLQVGMDLAKENPETYRKNADVIRNYDWLRLPEGATDDQAHEALINHVQSNLVALYDAIHPEIRPTSSLWYDGANQKIVNGMASEYGRRPENIAGTVAALSPQRDWFMNVENARRVADVLHHQADMPISAAMEQWGRNYANSRNPSGRVTPDYVNGKLDQMIGRPLSDMTPDEKAFYVRMYDAAHGPHPSRVPVDADGVPHPEGYYILNPDGTSTGRLARTNDGAVKRLTWGSGGQLANAIRSFEAEDMPTISRAMGNRHKVRNFYNNNIAPNSASGATTIDTHAIAGGLLQPLGASAPEVAHGLGMKGSKSNANGSSGLYPNYFEGYRRAANQISSRPGGQTVLPRQLQSITWEGVRGLFSPQERSNPGFIERIKNLWRRYARGRLSLRNVLQQIMTDPATGRSRIRPPQWVTGDDRVEDEAGE